MVSMRFVGGPEDTFATMAAEAPPQDLCFPSVPRFVPMGSVSLVGTCSPETYGLPTQFRLVTYWASRSSEQRTLWTLSCMQLTSHRIRTMTNSASFEKWSDTRRLAAVRHGHLRLQFPSFGGTCELAYRNCYSTDLTDIAGSACLSLACS